ncbi:MAG: hypothetical protein HY273_13575 [Gammaproteobacteria bacterium]|nr:hypothetical protein [Gammaproteobacteria bacterium]
MVGGSSATAGSIQSIRKKHPHCNNNRFQFYKGAEYGIGVDYMRQTGDHHPATVIGLQHAENLFPDLNVVSIFADFSLKF